MSEYDHLYKIIIMGNAGVGKSSILMQFVEGIYTDFNQSTIGIDFRVKTVSKGNKRIKLAIWDTAGQSRFATITSLYYREAQGMIFCFDLTDQVSFDAIENWIIEAEKHQSESRPNVVKLLIGTKADLVHQRKVEYDLAKAYADQRKMLYLETSSKTNININLAFERLIEQATFSPETTNDEVEKIFPWNLRENVNFRQEGNARNCKC